MTIVLFCPYRLEAGGLTTMVVRLQEGLRERGHRAIVLAAGDTDEPMPLAGSTDVYGMYLRRMLPEGNRLKGLLSFALYLPATLRRLRRWLDRVQAEVVHVHFLIPQGLYVSAIRPGARWRLAITFHGTDAYALPQRAPLYRALVRRAARGADAITAVSGDLLRAVREAIPGLRVPARVILNGNPLVRPRPAAAPSPAVATPPPDGHVLAVGSLIARKGYDVLIRAVRRARDRGRELDVAVVGTGPEADRLAALSRELGVADRVLLLGEVPHVELGTFYQRAGCFAHCAREEAFGLVLLEAMSCGKPVVATRVNGIPEIVRHGETGLLVPPDDPDALAEALLALDADPALRARLGEAGRRLAETDVTWTRVLDGYEALYRELRAP
jgi:glycosyltransferase involved in cell wall biosynthesis